MLLKKFALFIKNITNHNNDHNLSPAFAHLSSGSNDFLENHEDYMNLSRRDSRDSGRNPQRGSGRYSERGSERDYERGSERTNKRRAPSPNVTIRSEADMKRQSIKKIEELRQQDIETYLSDITKEELDRLSKEDLNQLILTRKKIQEEEEDFLAYIQTLSVEEGQGIVSTQLKVIGIAVLATVVAIFLIGNFLNKNNPLIPLFAAMNQDISINIVDANNVKIMEVKRTSTDIISKEYIPNVLVATFLSLHSVLETVHQETIGIKEGDITADQISDLINQKSVIVNFALTEMENSSNVTALDDLYSKSEQCFLFRTLTDLENTKNCRYDFVNFTLKNVYQEESSSVIMQTTRLLRYKLLSNWIQETISPETFLQLMLNILYFGNQELGLMKSYNKYFPDTNIQDLNVAQSVFLIGKMYQNSKKYYPNYNITYKHIIEMLAINNPEEEIDVEATLEEVEYFEKSFSEVTTPSFFVELNDIFLNSYEKFFPKYNIVQVNTSFLNTVQNIVLLSMSKRLTSPNSPNPYSPSSGAFVVIKNNNIVGASSFRIDEKDSLSFHEKYPDIFVFNALKPVLYLSLLENKTDVTALLLKSQYQNLIFSNRRLDLRDSLIRLQELQSQEEFAREMMLKASEAMANDVYEYNLYENDSMTTDEDNALTDVSQMQKDMNANNSNLAYIDQQEQKPDQLRVLMSPVRPTQSTKNLEELGFLEGEDIPKIPLNIKKQFAEQLSFFEASFLNNIDPAIFGQTFTRLQIKHDVPINLGSIYNADVKINFLDIVKLYSVFFNGGSLYSFINTINDTNGIPPEPADLELNIRNSYIDILKDIYMNKYSTTTSNYFLLIDFQVAIAFSKDTMIVIWMGDENQSHVIDNSEKLELAVKDIIQTLG